MTCFMTLVIATTFVQSLIQIKKNAHLLETVYT